MKKLIFLCFLISSCSFASGSQTSFDSQVAAGAIEPSFSSSKTLQIEGGLLQGDYIIKYAYGTMDVSSSSFESKKDAYENLIKSYDGVITSIYKSTNYQGLNQINIVAKIPSDEFDNFIIDIESIKKLSDLNINSNDVTVQVLDINSRIKSLEGEKLSLEEIKKDAVTTSEKLEVQSQLRYVNEQLEVLNNQKEYYMMSVSYSEISMSIREGSGISLFSWNYYVQRALRWLESLIGLTVSSLIFLIPLFILYFIYKKFMKKESP
jgi:hypothetical protein